MTSHWEKSYTKRVVDGLERIYPRSFAICDAVQLLIQYHRDMHVPYEQRDAYLAEVNRLQEVVRRQTMRLNEKDDELVRIKSSLPYRVKQGSSNRDVWAARSGYLPPKDAATELQNLPEKQNYMACKHYPDALTNFFAHRDHCEFCCEREPLKWFDNGHHREPGK